MNTEKGEFQRSWGTVLASCSGLAFGVATLAISYSIGVFIGPLNAEFGWSRQQVLVAGTIVSFGVVFLSPVVGWVTDRYGVRRLIIGSQFGFGLSFFTLVFIHNLWAFYAAYFVMGVVGAGTIAVTFAKLITKEFVKRRGLALGLAMSGTGLCGFAVPPFAAYIVETYGWRMGYFALGLLPLILALPLTIRFLRDARPTPIANSSEHVAETDRSGDIEIRQALTSYRFWAMSVAFLLGSCTMTALITNFIPILGDRGYAPVQAATMAGAFGLAVIVGRISAGLLIDRFWAPLVGFAFFTPAALAIALLAYGTSGTSSTVVVIAVAGLAAGCEVDLMGYLVTRYFGLTNFGKIYAGLYVMFALGPGITTPLFGGVRDTYGSYEPALYAAAIALAIAGGLLVSLGPYPREIKP